VCLKINKQFDWSGFSVLKVPPKKIMFNNNNNMVCRVLGLVACSVLISSRDVFKGNVLGFVAQTVDIS